MTARETKESAVQGSVRTGRPPYLRLRTPADRGRYLTKGSDFLARVVDLSGGLKSLDTAQSTAKHLAKLVATGEHDPGPAPTLGEMPDFEAELEALIDEDRLRQERIDAGEPPEQEPDARERFGSFGALTERWHECGIGATRTLYYLDIVGSEFGEDDPLKLGGFRASPHGRVPSHIYSIHGISTNQRVRDWLAYDLYLAEQLDMLGLSWARVESTIERAFLAGLPKPYIPFVNAVPSALRFLVWKHDLERWIAFDTHGERVKKAVENLRKVLGKTKFGPMYDAALENLRRAVEPPAWTRAAGVHLADYKRPGSPIERRVYTALSNDIWDAIEVRSDESDEQSLAILPTPAQRMLRKARGIALDQRPLEFWQLISDIAHHVPIIRGLPDQQRFVTSPIRRPAPQSWDAIRKIIKD